MILVGSCYTEIKDAKGVRDAGAGSSPCARAASRRAAGVGSGRSYAHCAAVVCSGASAARDTTPSVRHCFYSCF